MSQDGRDPESLEGGGRSKEELEERLRGLEPEPPSPDGPLSALCYAMAPPVEPEADRVPDLADSVPVPAGDQRVRRWPAVTLAVAVVVVAIVVWLLTRS